MKRYLFLLVIIVLSLFLLSNKPKYVKLKPEQDQVKIPVQEVHDGIPHYYRVTVSNKDIDFFLLMSNDGVIRAAFDACDVCFPAKKGYSYEGDYMICNNCGRRFHESKINVLQGGCNPAPLERTYDDEYVYISLEKISGGALYFL